MKILLVQMRKNQASIITAVVLVLLFLLAIQGMESQEWIVTVFRGLALSAIIFLVAAGFSLIFGLMNVMNFAHGTLFMVGAYIGWSAYVRPDTVIDLLPPLVVLAAGLLLQPLWKALLGRLRLPGVIARAWPWLGLLIAVVLVFSAIAGWPISKWKPGDPAAGPGADSVVLDQALATGHQRVVPPSAGQGSLLILAGTLFGGALLAASVVGFQQRHQVGGSARPRRMWKAILLPVVLLVVALVVYLGNDWLTERLYHIDSTWTFLVAVVVGMLSGALLGGLLEVTMIRPLYSRHIYNLMMTLGLGVIGVQLVQAIWGRPEFNVPKPTLFRGTGPECPATSLAGWWTTRCSTITLLGTRVRVYNEIVIILVGLIVLVAVSLLLQRTRLGMIIRAGVQDSEMVEALGINVRRVFTLVFILGVALATLGGALAGPAMGLSTGMGGSLLLLSLIAMAIGGLTSFPGAAIGALIVGLLQQFMIKYGQLGIKLPFLAEPFKPTPPLVSASTALLMVIILIVLPQGLLGRKE